MGEEQIGLELDREWKRVNKLLAASSPSDWMLAVLEAEKIFVQVLYLVSYGRNIYDRIDNVSWLFSNMKNILMAQELCRRIVEEIGVGLDRKQATFAVEALTQGVLDMTGRDVLGKSLWHRARNQLNFFWGHHPQLLAGGLMGLLGLVALIWFLSDTSVGQWLTGMLISFARFVIARKEVILVLGGLVLVASGLMVGRRSEPE